MSMKAIHKSIPVLLLLCGVFFMIGWFLGRIRTDHSKIGDPAQVQGQFKPEAVPSIDQKNGELAADTAVAEYLDWSRIDDAKQFLRLRQDGEILCINGLLELAEQRSRATAARLLSRIAKHRAEVSFNYKGELPTADSNLVSEVNAVLMKFR